eukprot:s3128_g5.t1
MISFLARAAQAANMRDTKSTVDDAKEESDTKIEQGEDVKLEQGASAKRWCSNVRKQCSKMEGDLTLFQDGCRVGVRIKCDMSETLNLDATQHPCAIIPQVFASGNSENNSTNLMQIESFMESYSAKRNLPGIFRATSSCVLDRSVEGDTTKFDVPADGLPAAKDWLGVLESMLLTGIDVQREPLSVNEAQPVSFPGDDFHVRLQHGSVEVYKGYTKATAMMFIAALCAELDIDADWELVRPFIPALDKLFLVPVHAAYLRTAQLYFHLSLLACFFGSDAKDGHCMVLLRSGAALQSQAPSLVSLSLRFSEILVAKNAAGEHQASMNTAQRLQSVIDEFHSSKHMTSKFALDADKTRSILNLMTGTTPAPG